jgi:hypothetical protein
MKTSRTQPQEESSLDGQSVAAWTTRSRETWIGRVEYLYDDFGHKDYIGSDGDPYRAFVTGQTLRGALTWKFAPIH